MEIQLGDTVLYQLTKQDAEGVNRRREHAAHNMDLMRVQKAGYQAHVGNRVNEGEPVPMIVTRVWSATCVNGQVVLDGTDSLWVTSSCEGPGSGYWFHRS